MPDCNELVLELERSICKCTAVTVQAIAELRCYSNRNAKTQGAR
jgi:hypothetical protein